MENNINAQKRNPLEEESIGKLILKYSLPAIASSLVNSIYNIVDQIYVGNKIGELGNAATNVAFPLVMILTTLAMTFVAGSSASFSLFLGGKKEEKAKSIVGNGMTLMISCGILIAIIAQLFLKPILIAFGGRAQTLAYAVEYMRILAFGFPCAILITGASQLIRADGSPKYAMAATLSGAILNCALGHYGELSQYGRDIPLACVGIITKVSAIFNSVIFGVSQSTQPILGFNYGSGNYARVKSAFKKAAFIVTAISCTAFLCSRLSLYFHYFVESTAFYGQARLLTAYPTFWPCCLSNAK